ncbi:nucleotidyl transferase AbiEii/AbiGii toxin family protein [Bombilactobacillus bombi]|uniref:nucleotidyl transferase AbiEii/AbiGii toxin family protein n=1 Tax=Bombilactobacillus bombi TaxID=1303590 RepID=UPI0035E50728
MRNKSQELNMSPSMIRRNYFLEQMLELIGHSKYKDDFIIKGGFLLSSKLGIQNRSTMDLDTTIKNIKASQSNVEQIIGEIIQKPSPDGVTFETVGMKAIREGAFNQGLEMKFKARLQNSVEIFSMDITSGEIITPPEIDYQHKTILNNKTIDLKAYPMEQVLADKICSIVAYGSDTTRMRDFYDIFELEHLKETDLNFGKVAHSFVQTAKQRNVDISPQNIDNVLTQIKSSDRLRKLWKNFQKKQTYSKSVTFEDTIKSLEQGITKIQDGQRMNQRLFRKRQQQLKRHNELER